VVITLGARGCVYGSREGTRHEVPAFEVQAVDTTAAGDTFVGVLSAALGEGEEIPAALRRAAAGSALSVQRNGASSAMPTRDEIVRFMAN
jgi:ribokinase